jgi:hypothetical protein
MGIVPDDEARGSGRAKTDLTMLLGSMKTMRAEAVLSKILCIESQSRRPIAIGAMLVTAWLSTAATALANGPESQAVKSPTLESQSLRLRFDEGFLSLHSSQRPYTEVLGAIQKETGMRFHYTIPMSGTVTLSFKDVPVQKALKRLLGREAQLMFRFPEGRGIAGRAGGPEDVWILGKVSGPIPEVGGPADKSAASAGKGNVTRAEPSETPAPVGEPEPEVDPATSEIEKLTVQQNAHYGIYGFWNSVIQQNTVVDNGLSGIVTRSGSLVLCGLRDLKAMACGGKGKST